VRYTALIHLWRRRRLVADRDLLLRAATRKDHAAVTAIDASRATIDEMNPQFLKSVVRIAFTCCRWRWHPYDEDAPAQDAYDREKAGKDAEAVAAEIAWLDGGPAPNWPELVDARPSFSRQPRAILSPNGARIELGRDGDLHRRRSKEAAIRVDHQGLARWVNLLNVEGRTLPDWYDEIVDAYAPWSARLNGHGYSADAELDRAPDDWNRQFYFLVASALMDAAEERFESLLKPIMGLPDRSFCDVAETLIHAADVRYFNEPNRSSNRAGALRQQLVYRTRSLGQ